MLICKHSCRHKHCHLLAVGSCLEGGAYGHLGLAETDVAAYKAVHRPVALHISLDSCSSSDLVGGILIDKRCLELMLHVAVGGELKAFLILAGGIQFYQVAGYILEACFRALLYFVPCTGAELVESGLYPFLTAVFRQLVERVYRHEYEVVVLVDELYHLLRVAVDTGAEQSAELADAVVDMHDIVARLDGSELLKRHGELAGAGAVAAQTVFVETVENLMVSEYAPLCGMVDKAFVECGVDRTERNIVTTVGEYGTQTLLLAVAVAEYVEFVAVGDKASERLRDKVEILMIESLRRAVVVDRWRVFKRCDSTGAERQLPELAEISFKLIGIDHLLHGVAVTFVGKE